MKRLSFLFITFFLAYFLNAQNESFNNGDCNFFGENINNNNYQKYIDTIETSDVAHSLTEEEFHQLIDCLYAIDSINPKLNFYKAICSENGNINDTSFFRYYRFCIDHGFMKGDAYYNMGCFFINMLFDWKENDSLVLFDYSREEQKKFFNLAEEYYWRSYKSGLKEAVFGIGDIQDLKSDYLKVPKPEINLNQDSIIILTKIRDCGEFGGHFETIYLTNKDDAYNAHFLSDSVYCFIETKTIIPSLNSKYNGVNELISKGLLLNLINDINSYSNDYGALTNAPVQIAIISNEQVLYQRIQNSRWSKYLEFRQKAFNF